jgi:hypothetical protein
MVAVSRFLEVCMLFGFISLIGKLFIFLGVFGLIYSWIRGGIDEGAGILKFLPNKPKSVLMIGLLAFGVLVASLNSILFYAQPGMSYLVQYPWGVQNATLQPGFHARWFGEVIPFKKFMTIVFVDKNTNRNAFSGTAAVQEIRFNDSVTANVKMTARFELTDNESQFLPMAVAYRSQENLIYSTLIPTMQEAMRNSGRMYAAQEYISGKGGDFENAVLDQIRNGIFLLDIQEEKTYIGMQLVPRVVIGGGGEAGGQPNATDLISLLTALAARDLGVAVTEKAQGKAQSGVLAQS